VLILEAFINTGIHRTVLLKSKLPPSRKTRLERNEMGLERNETSFVSCECTGSTNTSHLPVFETCFV